MRESRTSGSAGESARQLAGLSRFPCAISPVAIKDSSDFYRIAGIHCPISRRRQSCKRIMGIDFRSNVYTASTFRRCLHASTSVYTAYTRILSTCLHSSEDRTMPKLTMNYVETKIERPAQGQLIIRDDELQGFGLRVTTGSLSYICECRVAGKVRRVTIGKHGKPWCDEPLRSAKHESRKIAGIG